MSRIGKMPVSVPSGVEVTLDAAEISVKGPLGLLKQPVNPKVKVRREGDKVLLEVADESKQADAMSGTLRALLANMVQGVTKGFERKLTLSGWAIAPRPRATS